MTANTGEVAAANDRFSHVAVDNEVPWPSADPVSAGITWPESCAAIAARHNPELKQVKQMIAGGVAGCVSKTCVAPLSRVTILMQVQSMRPHKFRAGVPTNENLWRSLAKIYKEEGVLAYWRGNGATVLHRFPYTAITFSFHGYLKEQLTPTLHARSASFCSAGISACAACTLCYPLDLVKTRLSAQTKTMYYTGIVDAFRKIPADEGFRGLFRGLPVTLCSVTPMIALNFGFYDQFHWLYKGLGVPGWGHALLAGATSGALSSSLLFPVDLIRRQMQMVGLGGRPAMYSGAPDAARSVFMTGAMQAGGPRSVRGMLLGCREFFRGILPELIKVTPNNAIMFAVHDHLKNAIWPFEGSV